MATTPDEPDSFLRAIAAAPPRPRPAPDLVGATIAQYQLGEVIGRGGMGIVYRATDTRLHRTVAIKLLQSARPDDDAQRERFLREARSAASITHPNIVTIHEVGEFEGRTFLVMELVTGTTLAERIARGPIAPDEALRIATGIARGLARAHANKIVHRDLKPSNVMLDADGEPKLLDFGLAKLRDGDAVSGHATTQGAILGTPRYMSPEQARGAAVDERSDVFAFGVIVYEMLTGAPPFAHDSLSETLAAILRDPHRPLREVVAGVPVQLEAVIDRCLAKAPAERYTNAGEVLVALGARGQAPVPRARRPRRAGWMVIALAVSLCAALAGALAWWRTTAPSPASSPRRLAITEWPPPKTASHDAAAAYAAGLQALRDANFTAAQRHLATATQLDPHFAAALLRVVLLDGTQSEPMRHTLNAALEAREQLDSRDVRLLELVQAVFREPDGKAAARMARALAADRRDDAEAQLWAAWVLGAVGDAKSGGPLLGRALELDPKFAGVEAFRAIWAEDAGDLDVALAAAERCLLIAPSATSCLRRRADIHAIRGDCVAFADDTRELLLREPESDVNYENRLTALAAQGAPVDALRELARNGEALVQDPKASRALAAANAARIAVYDGDFDTAEAKFIELEELVASSTDEIAHFPYVYRLGLYEEEGDRAKALASASDYLRRRPGWIYDGNGFPRAYALAIQHRYGVVSDAELIATRTAWLAEDHRLGMTDQSWAWLAYHAWPALTPAEARDAVAALPGFEPLRLDQLGNGHGAAAGRTFLLGGATERALPLLRDAAAWCGPTVETSADNLSIGWQFVMIQSHLYLGLALEQRGDTAGACAQYARVLERWGHARPKSVTADAAREHATALGCAAGVTRAKQP